jgi:hypothetical protein
VALAHASVTTGDEEEDFFESIAWSFSVFPRNGLELVYNARTPARGAYALRAAP